MDNKLNLDFKKVEYARNLAKKISDDVQDFVEKHTTISVERAVCRMLGIDGVDTSGVPFPNIVVNQLKERGVLSEGASLFIGNALIELDKSPQEIANDIVNNDLDITLLKMNSLDKIKERLESEVNESVNRIKNNRENRENLINRLGEGPQPYLYVIVATGNIYEDVIQAQAAARQGADVIAVIRSTGQSLLDYVPYGATSEGFGGTYATQENFRIMRESLDEVGEEVGRYIRLCNYCSGLCMPEIAVMGAFERLDMMLNDALYGVLFRDINMQRTIIDQFFSRVINAYA